MPVVCSICKNPRRTEIESAVMKNGASKEIAAAFGLSPFALKRHRAHTAQLLAATPTKKLLEATDVDTIVDGIRKLEQEARELLAEAKAAQDYRGALAAIAEQRHLLEFLATVSGAMHKPSQTTNNTTNIFVSQEKLDELIENRASFIQSERRRAVPALPAPAGD